MIFIEFLGVQMIKQTDQKSINLAPEEPPVYSNPVPWLPRLRRSHLQCTTPYMGETRRDPLRVRHATKNIACGGEFIQNLPDQLRLLNSSRIFAALS